MEKGNCEIANYYNHKRKWIVVGFFSQEPRDWPSRSKELIETAKFTALGDAFTYATNLAQAPEAKHWYKIIIR